LLTHAPMPLAKKEMAIMPALAEERAERKKSA
jgi:hypothetical protein